MKRFLSAILTLCMMISMVPSAAMPAFAAESTETEATIATAETQNKTVVSTWEYETYGEGITLTAYNGTATDVYVPSTVDGQTVIRLGDGLFYDNDGLNSVTLGTGITEIGNQAFYDCDNMVCIVTNEELTTIGAEAFYSCDVFNSIILYDAVTSIGENAFVGCPGLTIWCNIGTAGHSYAITNDVSWEELNPEAIPETVVLNGATYYISNGSALLMSVEKADRIVIPAYVNFIPVNGINKEAFSSVYDTELFLPETITRIPDDIVLGERLVIHCGRGTYVHDFATENNISVILTDCIEPDSVTDGDFLFYIYNNEFAAVKSYFGSAESVAVPAQIDGITVTKILPYAFNDVTTVTSVRLPDSIDYIYTYAFYSCDKLSSVNIPNNVSRIATKTFMYCSKLADIQLHDNITRFESNSFSGTGISKIDYPEKLEYIGSNAFSNTQITAIDYPVNITLQKNALVTNDACKVYVPENAESIDFDAFDAASLTSKSAAVFYVYSDSPAHLHCVQKGVIYQLINDTADDIYEYRDSIIFEDDSYWEEFYVNYIVYNNYAVVSDAYLSFETYDENGNVEYVGVTEYEIPEQINGVPVTMIMDNAFASCGSLIGLVIPESVYVIGEGAFSDCHVLESINIPSGVEKIRDSTFSGCSALVNIELPSSLKEIGTWAFSGAGIESISFPASLEKIGEWAFSGSDIQSLDYPICEVGGKAFAYCENLKELRIPDGVTELPQRVFMGCYNLVFIYAPASLVDIDKVDRYTFSLCTKAIFICDFLHYKAINYAKASGKMYSTTDWVNRGYVNHIEYTQDGITYWLVENAVYSTWRSATVIGYDETITGEITIPSSISYNGLTYTVDRIGDNAFVDAPITKVTLPSTLKIIGDRAFQSTDITEIDLPDNLDYFGVNIFNATKLERLTFPVNYNLNFGVLASTPSVKEVTLPEGVKVIPEWALYYARNIEEIILPESLEIIEYQAIYGINALEELTIPANTALHKGAIGYLPSLKKLVIREGVTQILANNFGYCNNLSLVYLPKSITYIDYSAFRECPKAIFCVYEDTYAHEYCEKRGLPYFILTETENPEIAYGAGISGTVSYTDGTAASGASVEILYDDGTVKETVTTDDVGAYAFTYAEVGRYTIRVTDASCNTASSQVSVKRMNVFDVFLAGDTNLTLKKGWTVSGTVAGGAATVTITDEDGNVLDSVESADGSFAFDNIPNGSYIIKAETENGTVTQEITVFDGAVSDITLTVVSENVTVWGYVEVEDREYNHHRRNWVQVSIYSAEGTVVAQAKSDKDGMYRFEKLPIGQYSIVAETAEMRPDKKHSYDRSHSLTGYAYVDASAAGEYQADTIVLYEENDSLATISGKVTAQGESQACQVVLRNVFRHEVAQQTTGKNGKYSFTNVRDGLYFITAITESNGMGYTVVAVRNGKVHGETDITIRKADKIKDREDRFHKDFDSCHDRDTALKHKDRIVEEKRFYDGLSDKEKKQLSREYVDHLNRMCEWIAECEYVTDEGVTVEQGGLVISGDELENEDTVTFEINVEKTDAWTANTEGVKEDKDFIYHDMHDKAGKGQIKQYYEISMTKTVDGQTKQITSVTKDTDSTGKFRITMEIPEEYRGHKHYTMLHVHNGETVTLADLDDDPNTITFEVDGFSTFALTGTDEILVPVANAEIWQDTQLYGNYTTLEEAVTAYDSTTQYVKLTQDAEVTLSLTQDLYIDLNGYTLTGTIISNGYMIYGMDSTTNSYTCDTMGYFNCTDADGSAIVPEKLVKTTTEMTGNVLRYMTVETESGYTFHRFYLGITHTSLKPSVTGVGYQALFCGDDMVKAQLDADNAFGYTMQLDGFRSVSVYKGADHFISGKTVTLRINNYDAQNFGETPLHAFVNMKLADGTLIESALYTVTLRQLVESVNESYTSYTETQLAAVISMIEKNSIMQSWNVSNLYSEESAE